MPKRRLPADLTHDELVDLVAGLREVMYGDTDDTGNFTWDPDRPVNGGDLVAWVEEEMHRLGLVPRSTPRKDTP